MTQWVQKHWYRRSYFFGAMPSLSVINYLLPEQREGVAAILLAQAEMATFVAELRISKGIRYK